MMFCRLSLVEFVAEGSDLGFKVEDFGYLRLFWDRCFQQLMQGPKAFRLFCWESFINIKKNGPQSPVLIIKIPIISHHSTPRCLRRPTQTESTLELLPNPKPCKP